MINSISVCYRQPSDLDKIVERAASLPCDQILIQIFSGVLDQTVIQLLLADIRKKIPGVAVVGTSTAGEIVNGRSLEGELVINATFFEHTKVKSAIVTQNDDLSKAGKDLALELKQEDLAVAIVFGCGLKNKKTIKGQILLNAIQEELPDIVIAGGQAGDNAQGNITFVFTENGITENGVVAAGLISRHISAGNAYNLSWIPIGQKLTITKVKGSRVYSINNKTPYEIYCHYLGQEVADNLPLSAADFPFIIEKDGIELAIHATGVNDDGSFEYIHDFHVGEQLRFGFCHAGLLAVGAMNTYEQLRKQHPQALFVYSCVSRKWVLGMDIGVELSSVEDLAPSAGFFCYGEYFSRDNGKACFFSQTMTVLSLSELPASIPIHPPEVDKSPLTEAQSRQFRTLRVLHRLVDTTTREIELMNDELARLVRIDSLTGLSNRRRFDEKLYTECQRLSSSGADLSLVLLDADYFKSYNDTYGHVAGDSCLRGLAEVLRNVVTDKRYVAARFGGEEFICLLPETGYEKAMEIAHQILKQVNLLGISHKSSVIEEHVTVSIGVFTQKCSKKIDPASIVKACDEQLYIAKANGRNQVAGTEKR